MNGKCEDTAGKVLSGIGTLIGIVGVLIILMLPLLLFVIPALIILWYTEVYRPRKKGLVNPRVSDIWGKQDEHSS